VIAHISGVPAEELVPVLSGAGAGLLVVRGWMMLRLRRRRKAR
jgi:nitrate reductase gamma subunit